MDNTVIHIDTESNARSTVKDKILKLLDKKNLKIFILIFIGIVGLIIFFGMGNVDSSESKDLNSNSSQYITTLEYCEMLESKLENVLSSIDNAGQVSVMISVDGSPELVYATESDETLSSNSSGTTTSNNSSTPIIVEVGGASSALILTEKLPEVKGVIVVSSGAGNVSVKLNILNAVSTLLDISTDKISVLKGI